MIDNYIPGVTSVRHKDGRMGRVASITNFNSDEYEISWLCDIDNKIYTDNIYELKTIRKFK